jgi:hypothetical protein
VYGRWWEKKCREERESAFLVALVMPSKMATSFGFFVEEDFKLAQYIWSCFLHLPPAMATLLEST